MPTNEERREAASMLRELTKYQFLYPVDLEEFAGVVIDITGLDCFECKDGEAYARLADYIDPEPERTCRKIPGRMKYGRRMPACSECGQSLGDKRWKYCPNCGAKIRNEDDK